MSQKHENLGFSTCFTLLRSYSIYLINRIERSLNKSSFSVFQQKQNFILPFAVNVMLNLSNATIGAPSIIQTGECEHLHRLSSYTEKAWLNGWVATQLKEEKKWCF